MSGCLYVVATPLGNLGDITERAKGVLNDVDEWIVEDTRRAGKLRERLKLARKPMTSYYDENESRRTPELIEKLTSGLDLALMTDSGTPVIADPGFELVREARREGLSVRPVPGVSAPIAALSVSGFPSDEFLFIGYFPRTDKKRRDKLLEIKYFKGTVIFFEAPHRIRETLKTVRTFLGDRELFLAREMTKRYEDYRTGSADDLLQALNEGIERGEFTVLVHPVEDEILDPEDYLRSLLKKGMKLSEAAQVTAEYSSERRSDLYRKGLEIQERLGEGYD